MRGSSKAYWAEYNRLIAHTSERGEGYNRLKMDYIRLLIDQHLKLADVGGYASFAISRSLNFRCRGRRLQQEPDDPAEGRRGLVSHNERGSE